jgi:hypothetical protein
LYQLTNRYCHAFHKCFNVSQNCKGRHFSKLAHQKRKIKKRYLTIARLVISFSIGFYLNTFLAKESTIDNKVKTKKEKTSNMKLGTFSISLSVKDNALIRLFQGNILTFNPGCTERC